MGEKLSLEIVSWQSKNAIFTGRITLMDLISILMEGNDAILTGSKSNL